MEQKLNIIDANTLGYSEFCEAFNILYDNSMYIEKCRTAKGFPVNDPQLQKSMNALQQLLETGKMDLINEWADFFEKLIDIQENPPKDKPITLQTPIYNGKRKTYTVAVKGYPSFDTLFPNENASQNKVAEPSIHYDKNGCVIIDAQNVIVNNYHNTNFSLVNNNTSGLKLSSIKDILSWLKSSKLFKK